MEYIVSYRIVSREKTLISYRYRIESKKSLSLLTDPSYSIIPAIQWSPAIRWSPPILWYPAIRWSIGNMDFDNPKVYGDTSITDRLVYCFNHTWSGLHRQHLHIWRVQFMHIIELKNAFHPLGSTVELNWENHQDPEQLENLRRGRRGTEAAIQSWSPSSNPVRRWND